MKRVNLLGDIGIDGILTECVNVDLIYLDYDVRQ
jgi:hypothetical protein